MKIKLFVSFAAFVAASALMCSCSNEESADSNNNSNSNGQLTAFTGGIVTEAPMERMQLSTPEISTEVPGFLTRTSMNRNALRDQGAFLWEPNDVIYVKDDNGKLYKSQSTINGAAARATFLLDGSYTANQYDVYYCGTNSGAGEKKVVIASNQTQVDFNNTKHFGAAGDCGVAKAKKTTVAGESGYRFELAHKASYLCFLPYMAPQWDRANLKLKSIEITSDNNIAGTYDLTQTGLSATGTNESKTITLNVGTDGNGLKLADQATATKSIKNSLYVVIAPGTHALKVKYTVLDAMNKVATITKSYKSHTFGANKICDIPVDLSVRHYSGRNYYMWDAKENYWSGHEWDSATPWQPIEKRKRNNNYPKSKAADASRWYHEGEGSFEASVNPLFKKLPNANEMAWYVKMGDAHWDDTTLWEVFGQLHTGGIWLKKLSVIAQENDKELADLKLKDPKGNDLRVSSSEYNNYEASAKSGKPADSEIDNYFFLPALGNYMHTLRDLGNEGHYWSSSADPNSSSHAYGLGFERDGVGMSNLCSRRLGVVAQPFE
ncbi:hypothetical protein [Hoylesella timonensis]|uniref:hypothetical protein n=1 Tax=Hoylesella timonensis TaxID=386414 RepID=UPI00242DB02B|nr:hypothetical protein [Hoylesella timonensis]